MRRCCLSRALVHAFRQQVALWDQKFIPFRWVMKKKERERETAGERELSPRLCLLLSGTDTMKLSHVQMEASQAANRSLRDDGIGEWVFFFFLFLSPRCLRLTVKFVVLLFCLWSALQVSVCRLAVEIADGKVATVGAGQRSEPPPLFLCFVFFFCLFSPCFA